MGILTSEELAALRTLFPREGSGVSHAASARPRRGVVEYFLRYGAEIGCGCRAYLERECRIRLLRIVRCRRRYVPVAGNYLFRVEGGFRSTRLFCVPEALIERCNLRALGAKPAADATRRSTEVDRRLFEQTGSFLTGTNAGLKRYEGIEAPSRLCVTFELTQPGESVLRFDVIVPQEGAVA